MVTKVASGVHRLGDSIANFYVLIEGTDLTLVDAGLPAHYDQLTAALKGIGRSVRDVRDVLLTHAHLDHIGLAERLRRETGATVWVHKRDVPALANHCGHRPTPNPRQAWAAICCATPPRCGCRCTWHDPGRSAHRPSPRPATSTTA